MLNADIQCTVGGERRPKGREEFLSKFLLSCHKNMTFISQKLRGCRFFAGCWNLNSAGRQLGRKDVHNTEEARRN